MDTLSGSWWNAGQQVSGFFGFKSASSWNTHNGQRRCEEHLWMSASGRCTNRWNSRATVWEFGIECGSSKYAVMDLQSVGNWNLQHLYLTTLLGRRSSNGFIKVPWCSFFVRVLWCSFFVKVKVTNLPALFSLVCSLTRSHVSCYRGKRLHTL